MTRRQTNRRLTLGALRRDLLVGIYQRGRRRDVMMRMGSDSFFIIPMRWSRRVDWLVRGRPTWY